MSAPPIAPATKPRPKPENLWLNLLCNIVVPTLVLSQLSKPERLGPLGALLAGLAFPLGYGIYDLIRRRTWNVLSMVGLASVGLSGGFGILKVGGLGFAVKDAAVPTCFAVALLVTMRSRRPLVRELVLNESVIDVPRVMAALQARDAVDRFENLMRTSTWWLVVSFLLSGALNFLFARLILTAPAGSVEFTQQLGTMTWVSHTVLIVPNLGITLYVLWRLFAGLERLTGLKADDIFHAPASAAPDRPAGTSPKAD